MQIKVLFLTTKHSKSGKALGMRLTDWLTGSISKVVFKAVKKTILWLQIHRLLKNHLIVETTPLQFKRRKEERNGKNCIVLWNFCHNFHVIIVMSRCCLIYCFCLKFQLKHTCTNNFMLTIFYLFCCWAL